MLSRETLKNKLITIFNVFLVLTQGVLVVGYVAMVDSKKDIKQISDNLYTTGNPIMNNQLLDYLMSTFMVWLLVSVFIFSLGKEFFLKNRAHRLIYNTFIFGFILTIFGFVSYGIFAPINET